MKKLLQLAILFIIITAAAFAQQKELTLRQVTVDARSVYPKMLSELQWRPETNSFSYIERDHKSSSLVAGFTDSDKKETLLTVEELSKAFESLGLPALRSFPRYYWSNKRDIKFWRGDSLYLYDIVSKEFHILNSVKHGAENLDYTKSNLAAYTVKNNLYLAVKNKQIQITNDKNAGIVNGQLVSRNEFGINKGTFFSPKDNYLAFYRKDQSKVTDYPLVDIDYRPAKLVNIKYPMAGMTSEQVNLGVYNIKTGKTIFLKTGNHTDHYLTGISWDPSEKYIYIGVLNRDQNHLEEIKYDVKTGAAVKTLFEEKNDKYVQPLHGLTFVPNHPDEFIWQTRRDGWNHLYLYNTDGKLIKKLTEGDWEVTDLAGFDKNGDNVYFTSTKESPLDRDYYMVNLKSGEMTRLTSVPGVHSVIKDDDGNYFIDVYSSLNVPYDVNILNRDGKVTNKFYRAEDPLKDYKLGVTKFFKLKSKDGYDLYCRMILPADFDSTKKYPSLTYVYGGPGVQLITNRWMGGAQLWLNYMAAHGYVVFTLENRGSANRGLAFEQETFRQLGTKEIEDQTIGNEYLRSLPFIDSTKMGLHGWSFGGFMTTSLMCRRPGLYQVAVAGGSVINWKYYEVMYTERYMDTPQQNPEGYEKSDLLNYVQNLKGKLLMIHGTMDGTVVWQHDLMFIKKCADLGVPVDYFVYPGQEHGVRGIDTFHLYSKMTDYFNTNLHVN